jgi:hypothetical protein
MLVVVEALVKLEAQQQHQLAEKVEMEPLLQ